MRQKIELLAPAGNKEIFIKAVDAGADAVYCGIDVYNARMNAMNNANNNAQELIADLTKQYNYTRQNIITQEVTEVAAGARAHKKKREQALKKGES